MPESIFHGLSVLLLAILVGGCAAQIHPALPETKADAEVLQVFEFRNALYSSNPYSYESPSDSKEIVKALSSHWKQKTPAGHMVFYLKVQDAWAIFEGLPLAVSRARDWREACHRAVALGLPMGIDRFRAVLRKSEDRWQVVEVAPCVEKPATGEAKRLRDMGVPASLAENHTSMRIALQISIQTRGETP